MAPLKTQAPLPSDLVVRLERVKSRPDPWPMGRDDASRVHFAIHLERNGRKAGPFYWTSAVDAKHAQAREAYRMGESYRSGEPKATLTPEEAMHSLALDATCYLDSGPDLDSFAASYGDGQPILETLASFEACRKVWESFALLGLDPHSPSFQEA